MSLGVVSANILLARRKKKRKRLGMMARGNGRGICLVVVGRVPFCPTPKQGRCSSTSPPFHLSSVSLLAFTLASSALHLPAPPPLSLSPHR
jgi:hypothetical protein